TIIVLNGVEQNARFSFETFRFVQQKTSSTFYLHCTTRLCERSSCPALVENCSTSSTSRLRRNDDRSGGGGVGRSTRVSDAATVTSGPITTRMDTGEPLEVQSLLTTEQHRRLADPPAHRTSSRPASHPIHTTPTPYPRLPRLRRHQEIEIPYTGSGVAQSSSKARSGPGATVTSSVHAIA
ncbi:hypothetical protein CRUP_017941, partial [Coryphaenoides rupestris]